MDEDVSEPGHADHPDSEPRIAQASLAQDLEGLGGGGRHAEAPVGDDVRRHVHARLDGHLKGPLDDTLNLPVPAISIRREAPVLGDLSQVEVEVRQLAEDQVPVNHARIAGQEPLLHDPEVQELPERERLEAVAAEGVTVEDDLAGAEDSPHQRRRGPVEHHEVDLIGAEVAAQHAENLQPGLRGVRRLVEIDGDVHVAQGTERARRRAPEQVREDDGRTIPERLPQRLEPRLDVRWKGVWWITRAL